MKKKGMVRGEVWYVVSHSWFRKWEKACTGELDKEGGVLESQLGAVDNSDIVDDSGKLKGTVREGEDVEYVPLEVWKLFTQW
jgi:ubiquitin carboxyl-terminal hydrolase 4/11/15